MKKIFSWITTQISYIFFLEDCIFSEVLEEVSDYYKQKDTLFPLQKIYATLRYDEYVKNHLLDFKYHRNRDKLYLFEDSIKKMCEKIKEDGIEFDYIVFPPSIWWRRMLRGYNQSRLIAEIFWKHLQIPVVDCFKKTHSTKKQSTLSGEERLKNLDGSIEISKRFHGSFKDTRILLVDDVISTGSTVKICANLLLWCGIKEISGAFLARGK